MKSMTGFGKAVTENDNYQIDVEIKTVNQRFLDIQLRMPKEANPYEISLRQVIKDTLQRGRVEAYVNIKQISMGTKEVCVHWELIDPLLEEIQQHLHEKYRLAAFNAGDPLKFLLNQTDFVEVIEKTETDEALGELLIKAFQEAVTCVAASRASEGQKIKVVLISYLADFTANLQQLTEFVAVYEQEYRERFETKLNEWLGAQVDEARLLTEMAILLEKGDIHEELDRLAIHIDKLNDLLGKTQPVGRELDFLIQEMNREVNTIGSKSSSIEIKNIVVQMKTILEKIREQIQNVE
jgi:uncharacterized protein (TIGR00255 family)